MRVSGMKTKTFINTYKHLRNASAWLVLHKIECVYSVGFHTDRHCLSLCNALECKTKWFCLNLCLSETHSLPLTHSLTHTHCLLVCSSRSLPRGRIPELVLPGTSSGVLCWTAVSSEGHKRRGVVCSGTVIPPFLAMPRAQVSYTLMRKCVWQPVTRTKGCRELRSSKVAFTVQPCAWCLEPSYNSAVVTLYQSINQFNFI